MTESTLAVIFLGCISVCMLILTIVLTRTALHVRRVMRQLNAILPRLQRAIRTVDRIAQQAQQAADGGARLAHRVASVIERACEAASDALEPLHSFGTRVQAWLTKSRGVQARSGPRRNGRSS